MESYLVSEHYDLVTPDGAITSIKELSDNKLEVTISIENISPAFVGFKIDIHRVLFNLKSTLAQLGLNSIKKEIVLDAKLRTAQVKVELIPIGDLALKLIKMLTPGAFIGKLFAADERRRVREPEYLLRMFGRSDRDGSPLLSLGGLQGSDLLTLEKLEGRTVAFLALQDGVLCYEPTIDSFLPTLAKALHHSDMPVRSFLHMHQKWVPGTERRVEEGKILLVRTLPLHIRTVFGNVVEELLPAGYHHTSARILQPDTSESGDIYELFGSSEKEITDVPLEFYTLEPHREHVFFSDRDQLQDSLKKPEVLFKAFETSPAPIHHRAAVFVVKGDQLQNLTAKDWISRETHAHDLPGLIHPTRQTLLVQRYIQQQPEYPFLRSMEDGLITSQGALFMRYFPSPMMKALFLSDNVQRCLKAVYFQYPSLSYGAFFSHEDRSFLLDLAKFAIAAYWVDTTSGKLLRYVPKPEKDAGMFVPLNSVNTFLKATSFGIYGSNLVQGSFEHELTLLLQGILDMKKDCHHPLLNNETPIAMVTGGGPGVMEVGNRIAKTLGILSCADIVDFRPKKDSVVNEQKTNPYIDAKMTYRIDRLVERQAEFNLDFPIFLMGGIGTDFEFDLEELRRKVGTTKASPVIIFGPPEYWRRKITERFQCNLDTGTIAGSEWISNCFFCVQNAAQALKVYNNYFNHTLPIGPAFPFNKEGFVTVT